jgi:hypothetical protein
MAEPGIRERLAGCWRPAGYTITAAGGGQADHPIGDHPLGTILYTPDGYMSAQRARPGPYAGDDQLNGPAVMRARRKRSACALHPVRRSRVRSGDRSTSSSGP